MTPEFIYFDMGNVLLFFSHERQCRQMAEVAGVSPQQVREVMFCDEVHHAAEEGRLGPRDLYKVFCERADTRPDYEKLFAASNDIFRLNLTLVPVVCQLARAGHRLGLLSNTSQGHWEYVSDGRYSILREFFEPKILSFEVGAMKPQQAIFEAAAEQAGVAPRSIFYTDDRPEHVEAARKIGFDAVQYTDTSSLVKELRRRGVRFEY